MSAPPFRHGPRSAFLRLIRPMVFPIHAFVERNYHTENHLRLAVIRASLMRWNLGWAQEDGETATSLLADIDRAADLRTPRERILHG